MPSQQRTRLLGIFLMFGLLGIISYVNILLCMYIHVATYTCKYRQQLFLLLPFADIDRDFFTAKGVLEHLDKDELKYLFMELGLNYKTVQNKYDSPLNVYMNSLLEAWIFKRDLVVEKGGATWENLRAALERRGYRGHAEKI